MKKEIFDHGQYVARPSFPAGTLTDDNAVLTRLAPRYELSDASLQELTSLPRQRMTVESGKRVLRQGLPLRHVTIVASGWVGRSTFLGQGRRQITDVLLPGDIILPTSSEIGSFAEHIEALTRATLHFVDLGGTTQRDVLIDIMLRVQEADQKELRHLLTDIGKRSAAERLTHVLRRLDERLRAASPNTGRTTRIPLTQNAIADLAGLSLVHTNKSLKTLKEQGIVGVQNGQLMIKRDDRESAEHMREA